jgi:hypothetical protein
MTDSKAGNRTALHILGDGPVRFISKNKDWDHSPTVEIPLFYR